VALASAALTACFGCGTAPASGGALVPDGLLPGAGCGSGLHQTPCAPAQLPAECSTGDSHLGTVDHNPQNHIPQPSLGHRLLPRRADGHLLYGLNDQSYFLRGSQPRVGLSATEDLFAHRLVGSGLVRMTLMWGWMAQTRDSIDWTEADRAYCVFVNAGIRPILAIMGAPKWAVLGGQLCDRVCFSPPDPSYDPDLRRFAELAAIRYPQAAAMESWNEPNLRYFWHSPYPGGPGPDPARYVEVMRAIYEGVKSGNPSTTVVAGALSDVEGGAPDAPDMDLGQFLSGMYDAGARRWMDAVSFHPYPWGGAGAVPDRFHNALKTVRSTVAARDPGRRLWADEIGAGISVADGDFTEAEQSAELLRYYRELDASDDVDVVIFHSLIDDNHWGWLKPRTESGHVYPRPVFCSFVERFGALSPGHTGATLRTTAPPKKKHKSRRHAKRKRAKHHRTHRKRKAKAHRRAKHRAAPAPMDCSKPLRFPAS
jgi:hypothetical protein